MSREPGNCIYMTTEEFFTEYVKNNNLEKTQIIIVSRDVVSDIQTNDKFTKIAYDSKYDNIDFVATLLPTPQSMEYAYGDDKTRFFEIYEGHLLSDDVFNDIICIVDMVVNDGIDIVILSSKAEFKSRFPYAIKDFVYDKFGLIIRLSEELADAESEEEYNNLISNIGDVDEIKSLVDYYKAELTENKSVDEFVNRFMEDAPIKYRRILLTKTPEYVINLGKEKGLHLSRRKSLEELVDAVVERVFGNA